MSSESSPKQQSTDRHITPLGTHYPDSKATSLCTYSLILVGYRRSSIYQFYSTVKSGHAVTSIKQPPVLKGHLFLVLS